MQPYSPFNKKLQELQTEDLQCLKHTVEGWYVEYKQQAPNASTLAKSISAFANTYGGWLFLGIQEESKDNSVAGYFPGIPREDIDSLLQRMRKSAADHLNPTPYFETCVLWGPEDSIGLKENHAIICAWVPQSKSAPHVHKSGQIYRRVSDGSEPRAENDRFVLDQLWGRGEKIKRSHKKWYERDPEFAEHEKQQPYVRVMLIADRWAERDIWIESDDAVRTALGETSGLSSIPFDTVYTSADGFVGRQLSGNDLHNLVLTWRLRRNLVSDVIIPLPLYQPNNIFDLDIALQGYSHAEYFMRVISKYKTGKLRIVDLNYLLNILIGVAEIQERLCKIAGWVDSYYFKTKLLNAWRTIPYLDIPEVIQRFDSYGPPMYLDSVSSLPSGSGPERYFEVPRHSDFDNNAAKALIQAFTLFSPLARSFGIPAWISPEDGEEGSFYHESLQEAGRRAMTVQQHRNSRLAQ